MDYLKYNKGRENNMVYHIGRVGHVEYHIGKVDNMVYHIGRASHVEYYIGKVVIGNTSLILCKLMF